MEQRARTWLGVAGALLLLFGGVLFFDYPPALAKGTPDPILDLRDVAATGAAPVSSVSLTPITLGTAWRITVTVDTDSTFGLTQTETTTGTASPHLLNTGTALTAGSKYTFVTGTSQGFTYSPYFGTACQVRELLIEAVRSDSL